MYLASLKLSRVAGWGWVVGKSDFNENPVVSFDLDLVFLNTYLHPVPHIEFMVYATKFLRKFISNVTAKMTIFTKALKRNLVGQE